MIFKRFVTSFFLKTLNISVKIDYHLKLTIFLLKGRFYNNNDVHVPANRRDRRAINTVEAFCPEENAWEDCAPMIDPRYQHKQVHYMLCF